MTTNVKGQGGSKLHDQQYAGGERGPWGPGLAPVLPIAGHSGLSALDLLYLAVNCSAICSAVSVSSFHLLTDFPSFLLSCLTSSQVLLPAEAVRGTHQLVFPLRAWNQLTQGPSPLQPHQWLCQALGQRPEWPGHLVCHSTVSR